MLYERFKNETNKYINNENAVHLLSGGASGIISIMAIYPLETARSHLALQFNKSKYNGLTDVFKIVKLVLFPFLTSKLINWLFSQNSSYKDDI